MQPLVTEDIHGPDSELSLQTVLKSPAAVAIFSPISEQKEPSTIRALQVFPGHPRLGAGQAASGGRALHPPGWASSCQRRGRDAGAEFRYKRTNSELKKWLFKAIKMQEFCHMQW